MRKLEWLAAAVVAAAACGGSDATGPQVGSRVPFRVIAGGGTTDTIQARLTQSLIVEIHDSTGAPGRGKTVRFESLPPDDVKRRAEIAVSMAPLSSSSYSTLSSDVADSLGRARTLIALGTVAGTARVRVTVPEYGRVDTVTYTVMPGNATRIVIGVRDTTVQPSASYSLRASIADRFSNPTADVPGFGLGPGVVSVTPAGQVTVGPNIQRNYIAVSFKTLVDTARVTVMPRLELVGSRFTTSRMVMLVNTDGSGYTELASSGDGSLSAHKVKAGNKVVFYQGSPDYNAAVSVVENGAPAKVLAGTINGLASAAWPRLSPDGAWVYFVGMKASFGQRVLWRIRPDGTGLDSLGTVAQVATYTPPGVSPNGQSVAMEDANAVKVINVATKTFTMVRTPCGQPHYSPDGTQFACIKGGVISVMNVDGSNARQVTKSGDFFSTYDDLSSVDWTPDGTWLVARSQLQGPQLVNVADGNQTIPLSVLGLNYTQLSFVK